MKTWPSVVLVLGAIFLAACGGKAAGLPSLEELGRAPAAPAGEPIQVDIERDLLYTDTQKLDVHAPSQAGPWPVVVILHGLGGDKSQYTEGATAIARAGAVVYNASWRSVPWEYGELALMEDAACAVRYARSTAAEHGGDPERVVLFGHSIGGWSGAVVALAGDRFGGECRAQGVSALPQVFVGYGGVYDAGESGPDGGASYLKEADPDLWGMVYPFALIGGNPGARFELVVGSKDVEFIPVAERFLDALRDAGYAANLTVLEGEGHDLSYPSPGFDRLVGIIVAADLPR